MNLIDALKTGKSVRRPIAKHWGATRSGYLGNEYVKNYLVNRSPDWATLMREQSLPLITETDLMATDWEALDA